MNSAGEDPPSSSKWAIAGVTNTVHISYFYLFICMWCALLADPLFGPLVQERKLYIYYI